MALLKRLALYPVVGLAVSGVLIVAAFVGLNLYERSGMTRPAAHELLQDQHGHPAVVLFGFTACPDVCPTSLAYMAAEWRALGPGGAQAKGVFVSVDPEHDTPARLAPYVQSFNPDFVGTALDAARLKVLAKELGVFYEGGSGKRLAHTASLFIFDGNANLLSTLSPPYEPGQLAAALRPLIGDLAAH